MTGFKELHHNEEPLLLGNVWNVQSAEIYENAGYKALATSSSAVALSLGYEDGEQMSFDEYFYMIRRIKASVSVPLSVDLEAGYGADGDLIVSNITRLLDIGIAGINLEDTYMEDDVRQLAGREAFSEKLKDIIVKLKERRTEIFINVRTDPFLLGIDHALKETLERIRLFEELKIDGVFIPGMTAEADIQTVVKATSLPVNVMCLPGLPDFNTLKRLGIRRITSGAFLNRHIYKELERVCGIIKDNQSFSPLFT